MVPGLVSMAETESRSDLRSGELQGRLHLPSMWRRRTGSEGTHSWLYSEELIPSNILGFWFNWFSGALSALALGFLGLAFFGFGFGLWISLGFLGHAGFYLFFMGFFSRGIWLN